MELNQVDIEKYSDEYMKEHGKKISYEAILAKIRKEQVLFQIAKYKHEHVLEVGCGLDPLFNSFSDYKTFTIVEPSKEFVQNAKQLAKNRSNINVIMGFIEEIGEELVRNNNYFDIIVVSSLLHEVPDPDRLLKSIYQICRTDTIVHFNVPNVFSFHRLLAYEMGLIDSIFNKSELEDKFQRQSRFDKNSFIAILNKHGFIVQDFDTYFIKPFSNKQMEQLIDQVVVGINIINGLYKMQKYMPDLGCEMYANVKIN